MNLLLIDRFPILSRRLDRENLTKLSNELPSTFMELMFSTMYSSQLDTAPPVARALVKIIKLLRSDGLDKSVKEHLVKVMREHPNLERKEDVMTFVYALESDVVAKASTDRKERDKIGEVIPNIDCKVCNKQHKKRECKYQCKHCLMFGSHKAENCFKKYPAEKRKGK